MSCHNRRSVPGALFLGLALLQVPAIAHDTSTPQLAVQMTVQRPIPVPMQSKLPRAYRDRQCNHWNGRLAPGCYFAPRGFHNHGVRYNCPN